VKKTTKTYKLGLYASGSCGLLLAVNLYHDGLLLSNPSFGSLGPPEVIVFRMLQLVLTTFAAFASLSLPRRPHVFKDSEPVDGMYTVSALGRYTFAWVGHLLYLARRRKRLNLDDLPKMDHYTRSKDLSQSWAEKEHPRKLWVEVALAHKWAFIIQWVLTLLQAFGNFAPQFVTYHLLKLLEDRVVGQPVSSEAWVWVVVLTLTTIGSGWIESWLFWISWSEIAIPVRSQLSALIFQKAMRRKDVKGASKTKEKEKAGPDFAETPIGDSTAADKPEIEEEEDGPKGKQSTVNLIGVDTKRISDFCSFNNYFPGSLFKLVVSFAFLLSIIGWKALLAGFLAFFLTVPLNIIFSKRYAAAQDRLRKVRDAKMGVVTEALQGKDF
jgi:ABC-type multidrug transport system fused ATPase/permease subunit